MTDGAAMTDGVAVTDGAAVTGGATSAEESIVRRLVVRRETDKE